jgi:predicted PurR-regulated permease PerM
MNVGMSEKIKNLVNALVLIIIFIAVLVAGESILIPAAWALIFAFIGLPVAHFLERKKAGRVTSSVVATLCTMIFLGLIFFFLFYEATHILKNQEDVYSKLKDKIELAITQIEAQLDIQILSQLEGGTNSSNVIKTVASQIIAFSKNLVTITLIPMYMFFILNYRGLIRKFVEKRYEGEVRERVTTFLENAKNSISNYLKGTLLLTGIATIMTFIVLLIFGIKYAFFFSLFVAILNLIPYIGNLIALVVVLLFTFLTKDSGSTTVFVFIALYVSNLIQENFLRPKFLGDKMEMNAAIVFTSALAGGLIWGVSGLILFIPLTGVVKAFIDSNPRWSAFGVFFESK